MMGHSQVREGRCSKSIDGEDRLFPTRPILSQRLLDLVYLSLTNSNVFTREFVKKATLLTILLFRVSLILVHPYLRITKQGYVNVKDRRISPLKV